MLWAKQKKDAFLREKEITTRIEENRRHLTANEWSIEVTGNFFIMRAHKIFGEGKFTIDQNNAIIFQLMVAYFSRDKSFFSLASNLGIENASFSKGLFLVGGYGVGKTWLMKAMQRNRVCCFVVKNAKDISNEFEIDGQEAITQYVEKQKNALNDPERFYQPYLGLCIDDMGTEGIKVNFGNRKNVVGDIIELRYAAGSTGEFLHATTNMNSEGLEEFYGKRVTSRLREIFNIIIVKGKDRRK